MLKITLLFCLIVSFLTACKTTSTHSTETKNQAPKVLQKEDLLGHYFGTRDIDDGSSESIYIVLDPYVYISYKFEDKITFEAFQDPIMGTWDTNNDESPHLVHLDIRDAKLGDAIFEIHLEILDDGQLKHIASGTILERTNPNIVPAMYHLNRSLEDKGHTKFYHGGMLTIEKAFADGHEIYSEEGLEYYNLGVFHERGTTQAIDDNTLLGDDEEAYEDYEVEVDYGFALKCYLHSAEMNYPPAMFNLAAFYEYGIGCEVDMEEAIKWYTAGAQAGHVRSIGKLGELLYFEDEAVPLEVDRERAAQLLLEAGENGDRLSQYYCGMLYSTTDSPYAIDSEKAETWYKRAASKGDPDAYYELARIHFRKCEDERAESIYFDEALAYLFTAYDMGNPYAKAIVDKFEEGE